MPLEIRQLPRMRLAYMRQTGPYGPSLTQLWERFGRWCEANRLSEPRPKYYGISLDNPACTPPAQCRYDACVQVGVGLRTGTEAMIQDFAGGDYACLRFVGTGPEIGAAWASMMAPGQIPAGWEAAPPGPPSRSTTKTLLSTPPRARSPAGCAWRCSAPTEAVRSNPRENDAGAGAAPHAAVHKRHTPPP